MAAAYGHKDCCAALLAAGADAAARTNARLRHMGAGARGPDPNPNPGPKPCHKPKVENGPRDLRSAPYAGRATCAPMLAASPVPAAPGPCPPPAHEAAWVRSPASRPTCRRKAGEPQSGTQVEPWWNLVIRAWNPGRTGALAGVPAAF